MSYKSHKSLAKFHLDRSRQKREVQGWREAEVHALTAQAEAMLALAEQQRISNVIALSVALTRGARVDLGLGVSDHPITDTPVWVIAPDVADALGIDEGLHL